MTTTTNVTVNLEQSYASIKEAEKNIKKLEWEMKAINIIGGLTSIGFIIGTVIFSIVMGGAF